MTEKQMRAQLFQIWYRWRKLSDAVNVARQKGLIKYPDNMTGDKSVNTLLWDTRKAIEKYTKDQVAEIVHQDIREQV